MAVGPVDADGVVADELHSLGGHVFANCRGVEYPLAGPFIDALRAAALAAEEAEGEVVRSIGPCDLQYAVAADGFHVARRWD
jgi:hypothetical protein